MKKGIKPAGQDSLAHANSSAEVTEADLKEGERRRAGELEGEEKGEESDQ